MKIKEIKCKTALSKSKLPGLEYSLNPYRGCQHKCAYCYVPNILRINRDEWGNFVDAKINIPNILSKELRKKEKGTVGVSTVTDPYQPVEKKYRLTRFCLEQLLIHDFPVCIQTKSDLITRDIDIISKFSNAEVIFSIGTNDDSQRKLLEPSSSPIKNRLEAMKNISAEKIKTNVFFGPIYPTIKKEDIQNIINTFIEAGASEIMVDKFNLKPGILQNIIRFNISDIKKLEDKKHYENILKEIKRACKEKNTCITEAF